jgi:phosphoglycerate dehydrogenase-like enzyme
LNYSDVWEAVETGHIAGLGIDVFHTEPFPPEDKFLSHPHVVASPHVAGVTETSYHTMAKIVADIALRVARKENLESLNVVV